MDRREVPLAVAAQSRSQGPGGGGNALGPSHVIPRPLNGQLALRAPLLFLIKWGSEDV